MAIGKLTAGGMVAGAIAALLFTDILTEPSTYAEKARIYADAAEYFLIPTAISFGTGFIYDFGKMLKRKY